MPEPEKRTAPYGSWVSPLSAERVAAGAVSVSGPAFAPDTADGAGGIVWSESRPSEGGRSVLVHRDARGERRDLFGEGFNARTRVHEYGGGSWSFVPGGIVFSNFTDQRLWMVGLGPEGPGGPSAEPRPISAEPEQPGAVRFADGRPAPGGDRLICVREDHLGGRVENEIVAVDLGRGEVEVLHGGSDFVSNPRPSPDGRRLAWLQWDHPQMPWDGTELWVAELRPDGSIVSPERIAGGARESIWQPDWSPGSELHYVSDRSGFWNLYRESGEALDRGAGRARLPAVALRWLDLRLHRGRDRRGQDRRRGLLALPAGSGRRCSRAARAAVHRLRLPLPGRPRDRGGVRRREPRAPAGDSHL